MEYYHGYITDTAWEFELLISRGGQDKKRIKEIYQYLKTNTGEDFGYDAEAWIEWLSSNDFYTVYKGIGLRKNDNDKSKK